MPTLSELINNLTVSDLKELLVYIPGAVKIGRKDVLIAAILQPMSGDVLQDIWEQLDQYQRLAVGEAVHHPHGLFDGARFAAKYGQRPAFHHRRGEGYYASDGAMTVLGLFLHQNDGYRVIPTDLQARLQALLPKPAANALACDASLPEPEPDSEPMTVRSTAPDALHDVVVLLRAVDQGQIAVSDKTHLPGGAGVRVVLSKLAGGDFYDTAAPKDKWEQPIGAIKAVAWPLLLQAGALAQLNGNKLGLTPAGLKALNLAPADVARGIWRKWLSSSLHDEFSRIDVIKGQKGKSRMSATAPRRAIVANVLQRCPVDSWVSVDELSRFMRAEGYPLQISHDIGNLYIGDPNYGTLAYSDNGWDLLQLRYLLCVLFEYCATLGMIDVAYVSPHEARNDYRKLWGADGITFVSRYDGLMYFRLTALGAYCLGMSDSYAPPAPAATCALAVQANLHVSVRSGTLSADDLLMLDNWATRESAQLWRLDREKAIAAIERGHDAAQLEAFLQARDSQPLPVQVESFLRTCTKQGRAMTVLATSLLIECVDPDTADLIAAHKDTARLCMRAGERHLVVRLDHEAKFRKAARLLGYGIPV